MYLHCKYIVDTIKYYAKCSPSYPSLYSTTTHRVSLKRNLSNHHSPAFDFGSAGRVALIKPTR